MNRLTTPTHTRRPRPVYRWHRRIGVMASIFVIWIATSGWLLNHSDSFNLAQRSVHSSMLANWYGLTYPTPTQVFASNEHWLIANEENSILDGKALNIAHMHPIGITEANNMLAIASENALMLFSADGELIDTLQSHNLPIPHLQHIGTGCGGIVIQGQAEILASKDGIDWQPCSGDLTWSELKAITPAQNRIATSLLIPAISLEKLFIDLHTGRFFGHFGPYVVDAIGGCLLLLALSGLWMFSRTKTSVRSSADQKNHPR